MTEREQSIIREASRLFGAHGRACVDVLRAMCEADPECAHDVDEMAAQLEDWGV